jgi:uncharacterized integral membrane protein
MAAPQTPAPGPEPERTLGDQLRFGGIVVAAVALLLFFFQNLQEVEINFLWFDWNTQMVWALLVSAVVGALAVWLGMQILARRQRRALTRSPERREG